MKNYIANNVREKYRNRALIVPTYTGAKNFYSVDDLEKFEKLEFCLGEVNDHEADITETGIEFLKDAFGLKRLAELLYENKWYSDEYNSAEAIYTWLKRWEELEREYDEKEGKFN